MKSSAPWPKPWDNPPASKVSPSDLPTVPRLLSPVFRLLPQVPTCTLAIKVLPNAPRNEIVGWLGEALKVKVHAPPVEDRANEALCEFLADALGLPRRVVSIVRGNTSRQKLIRIEGLTRAEVVSKLGL
jgi:uncharacterized protein (TIGR00251 family)